MMRTVVVTDPPRASLEQVDTLAGYGVATVHEAIGRSGFLGPGIRPVHRGSRIGGTAVTVLSWPGDNLMLHVAVEQCGPGDVLVVTTTSPSTDGMFGELIATALQ
ncbi:MAG: 4-carboxy-4-hydroxy-2-oxoadipate aldolase/oxaloacetate decarboxylase, partial [Actinomadura sp.]